MVGDVTSFIWQCPICQIKRIYVKRTTLCILTFIPVIEPFM